MLQWIIQIIVSVVILILEYNLKMWMMKIKQDKLVVKICCRDCVCWDSFLKQVVKFNCNWNGKILYCLWSIQKLMFQMFLAEHQVKCDCSTTIIFFIRDETRGLNMLNLSVSFSNTVQYGAGVTHSFSYSLIISFRVPW